MFLKVLSWDKFESELDILNRDLSQLMTREYKLALPYKNLRGKFHSRINDGYFCLMPFIEHRTILESQYPCLDALDKLNRFHADVINIDFPVRPHKTYRSYIDRGISRTKALYPIDQGWIVWSLFEDFMINRFGLIDFLEGNIHGDLNSYNLWVTEENIFYFADFDTAQKGALLKDILDIAAEYLAMKEWIPGEVDNFLTQILPFCSSVAPNLEMRDLKFLIVRPILPSIFDSDSKLSSDDKIIRLKKIENFLADSKSTM